MRPACQPAARGTQRVPNVASNQADVRGIGLELIGDPAVSLGRRLVAPHALVDAEAALEHVDHPCLLQLRPGDLERVVGEREEPEPVIPEPPENRRHLGMGRHRGEPLGELGASTAAIAIPRVAASIRSTAAPMSVNGT
jgi:hypothetical protein